MIVAGFPSADALADAAQAMRQAGIPAETRSPVALPADEHAGSRLSRLVLAAGLLGAAAGFGMQWYATVFGYRLLVGGRPNFFWTSFLVYAFECGVLAATLTAFVGFLAACRLPRLYEPSDECDALRDATRDGYFLIVRDRAALRGLHPTAVHEVASPVPLAAGGRLALSLLVVFLVGCDDMTDQPKRNPYRTEQTGPGQVPAGRAEYGTRPAAPPPVTLALLHRGQDRYRAFCTPCHSELGDGHGMVVQRGFSPPPSYHQARLRQAPTQHVYDVITNGYGAMYSFAERVPPADRWAIAAYIRALQRSTDARPEDLPPDQQAALR